MISLINKKALVTGASGSIGYACATVLHQLGAHVIISGTDEGKLSKLGDSLKSNYEIKICDLNDNLECEKLIDDLESLDILVCNAGKNEDSLALRMSNDSFKRIIDLNLTANFIMNRQAIKKMFKAKYGRIINISSVVAVSGNLGQANYCASKAGLIGMTKALAIEVATRGITVNVVAPGFIASNMTGKLSEQHRSAILQKIPQQQMGTSEDVAHAIAYLASDQARYITGQTIHVNGGMLMV